MNNNQKPTFGVTTQQQQKSSIRKHIGGVWRRQAKKGNTEFLSIKINLSKEKLKKLLEKDGEEVDLGFVAFTNPFKADGPSKPDFRVFEDNDTENIKSS